MMIEREASWSLLQYLICVLALNAGNVIVVKRAHWFTLERDGILDLFAVLPFLPIIICYLHVLLYPIYLDTFLLGIHLAKSQKYHCTMTILQCTLVPQEVVVYPDTR